MELVLHPAAVHAAMAHLKTVWLQAWSDIQAIITNATEENMAQLLAQFPQDGRLAR